MSDKSGSWACPRCGSTGYVVGGMLRCGNAGCPDTNEYDPTTGDRMYDVALTGEAQGG